MILNIFSKIIFALKHRTWKRVAPCKKSDQELAVYHCGKEVRINRRCPHQGLPLDKGYFKGDDLVCPWHGCRISLTSEKKVRPFVPLLHTRKKSS